MSSRYLNTISSFSKEELLEEEEKLTKVLSNLCQEHKDRESTIHLIMSQLEQVRNLRVFKYEETIDS